MGWIWLQFADPLQWLHGTSSRSSNCIAGASQSVIYMGKWDVLQCLMPSRSSCTSETSKPVFYSQKTVSTLHFILSEPPPNPTINFGGVEILILYRGRIGSNLKSTLFHSATISPRLKTLFSSFTHQEPSPTKQRTNMFFFPFLS